MSTKWFTHNFITGKVEEMRERDPGEPSQAWVDGWDAYMEHGDDARNPFEEFTQEHHDWQDGYEDARKD